MNSVLEPRASEKLEKASGHLRAAGPTFRSRVLVVGNFLSAQGIYGVCEGLADRLELAGHRVLRTSDKSNPGKRVLEMISTAWRQRGEYDVAQVDVYSGRAFLQAEAVCATLRRANKPYVLTLHGGNLPAFARKWPRRVRALLRSAHAVTVPSRYLLESMQAYHPDDLNLLPNPLNLSAYNFRLRSVARPKLIWLRAFHELYNPSLAPGVLAALIKEFPEACLTMIGPDKHDGSLTRARTVAQNAGVSDRVIFTGPLSKAKVAAELSAADIFLNTTSVDNVPISVLEAMATGLCVVSTNAGGIPYLLTDEHDALLVSPNNEDAMASAVRRILTEPLLAAKLSNAARNNAATHDWSYIFPTWEKLLTVNHQAGSNQ